MQSGSMPEPSRGRSMTTLFLPRFFRPMERSVPLPSRTWIFPTVTPVFQLPEILFCQQGFTDPGRAKEYPGKNKTDHSRQTTETTAKPAELRICIQKFSRPKTCRLVFRKGRDERYDDWRCNGRK